MANTVFTQMGNVVGTEIKNIKDSVTLDLSNETTDRTNADTALQSNIDIEKVRITTETTDRTNADTALQSNIDIEKVRITTEVSDRTNADTALQSNIDNLNTGMSGMFTTVGGDTIANQHILPKDPTIALGSLTKPFADVFISQSSLYVNGQKVLSEDAGTINISADDNQNVRISTGGVGDIEFLPTGNGNIELKGNVSLTAGKKIISSDGNAIVIDEDLNVQVISSPTITLLDGRIQSLETLTTSTDMNLDTLQEIVTFIKANRADLDSINLDWSALTNVPTEFTPSSHNHTVSEITDFDPSNYLGINSKAVDSDKLDGLDSTAFLRSDSNSTQTFLGQLAIDGYNLDVPLLHIHHKSNSGSTTGILVEMDGEGKGVAGEDRLIELRGNVDGTLVGSTDTKFIVYGDGTTDIAGNTTISANLAVNGDLNLTGTTLFGSKTKVGDNIVGMQCADGYKNLLEMTSSAQGSSEIYMGQDTAHGFGFLYNADDTPNELETPDWSVFYRNSAGVKSTMFGWHHTENFVTFRQIPKVNGVNVLTETTGMTGTKTISTSAPTGGNDGDIWIQV